MVQSPPTPRAGQRGPEPGGPDRRRAGAVRPRRLRRDPDRPDRGARPSRPARSSGTSRPRSRWSSTATTASCARSPPRTSSSRPPPPTSTRCARRSCHWPPGSPRYAPASRRTERPSTRRPCCSDASRSTSPTMREPLRSRSRSAGATRRRTRSPRRWPPLRWRSTSARCDDGSTVRPPYELADLIDEEFRRLRQLVD